jgi:hypothetical protein
VAVDGKSVGALSPGQQSSFPVASGKHKIEGVNTNGVYWVKEIEVSGPDLAVNILLQTAAVENSKLEAKVQALKTEVSKKQQTLQEIQKRNELLASNPNLLQSLRQQIVKAILTYSERWGRESQLGNARKAQADSIGTTGFSGAVSGPIYSQATRNFICGAAASKRIDELVSMLEDPISATKDVVWPDYTVIIDPVWNGKRSGELITAPDRIEYRDLDTGRQGKNKQDDKRTVKISCSAVTTARTSGPPVYRLFKEVAGSDAFTIKYLGGSLSLKASSHDAQNRALGDVFLACPDLTK